MSGGGAVPGIDRRAFLSRATLAAVAVALAACGSNDSPTAPSTVASTTLNLSDHPELAQVDGYTLISVGGSPVAVVRASATAFVALSRICPHRGFTVNPVGGNTTLTGFFCPGHGAEFGPTGNWTGGQPTNSLMTYPAVYDATANTVTIGS
jgi:Rieske Fe-S protein